MPDAAAARARDSTDGSRHDSAAAAATWLRCPGAVQPFGCLVVLSPDWIVQSVSANSAEILGRAPEDLLAARPIELLPAGVMHSLRGKLQTLMPGEGAARVFGLDLLGDGRRFDVTLHRGDGVHLFEFEPAGDAETRDDQSVVLALLARVRRATDIEAMCAVGAEGIWAMTGFDRVTIHRFEPDFSGRVIAECLGAGAESYLGRRFPAADLPPEKRALYETTLARVVADVDAPVAPLVPATLPGGEPVDLSHALTRPAPPMHLQYLRNMGVAAAMTVSILVEGRLWGVVACHHPRPHRVDARSRAAVEMFTQLLSYELALAEARALREQAAAATALHERLALMFEAGLHLDADLRRFRDEIAGVLDLDGIALRVGGGYHSDGLAPSEAEYAALLRHLGGDGGTGVFVTDDLARTCPGAVDPVRGIGGMIAIPLHHGANERVLLLRREVERDEIWAGPPETAAPDSPPRRSFAAWRETVRGRSLPWTEGDRAAAETLRVALLERVLRQADDRGQRADRLSQRQEVLMAELTHRLRNAFGLVSGLIAQRMAGAGPEVAAFGADLRARIEALARASDLLTSPQRGPVSLQRMIEVEAAAYADTSGRIDFTGDDPPLREGLHTTLALVIHELVTNSSKHGALGPGAGRVAVEVTQGGDGVSVTWTERGGPPVRPPSRRGFGSTLLARAIPHELGGQSSLDYQPDGLVARFTLPAAVIDNGKPPPRAGTRARSGPEPALTGAALVVEDNLLIAMNAADALKAMGAAEVAIAPSVGEALDRLQAGRFQLAVLDRDLGGQSSAPVAEALRAARVPFLLATGYDHGGPGDDAYGDAPRLMKPYSSDAIAAAVASGGLLDHD